MPSYEQRAGRWSVRFRHISNGEEKQIRLSGFNTKREATAAYHSYIENEESQKRLDDAKDGAEVSLYFSDLVSAYLKFKQGRVKETTLFDITSMINRRILPAFANKLVSEITPASLLEWQDGLKDLAYNTQKTIRTQMGSIWRFGAKYYDIKNTLEKVDAPRRVKPKQEMQFWSKEEFCRFYAACTSPLYRTFFKLLYITGCRKGEAMALYWSDIDFRRNLIRINKSIAHKSASGGWMVTTPKNAASVRKIEIPKSFCEELKEYREWQREQGTCEPFVFGGDSPLPRVTIDRKMDEYCAASGVKRIRIHDLRHSCASLLISEGISIVAVSKRLGHTDIEQTLNTYSHMMPSDSSAIINILDKI